MKLVILVVAVGLAATRVSNPLLGEHTFRQSMVASNIEAFVAKGNSLVPALPNKDHSTTLFDFPFYQWLAAAVGKLTGLSAAESGRIVNLALFALTFLLLDDVMARTSVTAPQRMFSLALFAFAPLTLFDYSALFPDVLAIALSIASLGAYLRSEEATRPARRYGWFLAVIGFSVTCLFIKNPVYLPVMSAIVVQRWASKGWRSVCSRDLVLLGTTSVATIITFKIVSAHINGSELFAAWERYWFFSNWADRTAPDHYVVLAKWIGSRILNPLTLVCAAGGVGLLWHSHHPYRGLYVGWLGGCLLVTAIFFNLHWRHDYYLLPFVFPLAFPVGYLLGSLWDKLQRSESTRTLRVVGLLALAAVSGVFSWTYYQKMTPAPIEPLENGRWIQSHTGKGDFVIYVLAQYTWAPTYLYFAKRDGFNLSVANLSLSHVEEIRRTYGSKYRTLYLYVPHELEDQVGAMPALHAVRIVRDPDRGSLRQLTDG